MNILFLTKSFGFGGVSIITTILANEFHKLGHQVNVFVFYKGIGDTIEKRFKESIKLHIGNGFFVSSYNVNKLRNILVEEHIDIIINQWGLPSIPTRLLNKAKKGLDIKVISVYHNDPQTNARLKDVEIELEGTSNSLKKWILKMKWNAFKAITSKSMRFVYNHSDRYMVLSPSYVEHFKKFTGIKIPTKLLVQTNPITINTPEFIFNPSNKRKEIIYVGRLDFVQKRVYRVIDTWNYLEESFPNWKLTIVGNGEDRTNLERHTKALGLQRVSFEGFKNPIDYYKRASLLLLTSDFEGFPLVLAEAMSFGVIPVVYGSYSAVYDIIEDGKDGIILPQDKTKGYVAKCMADRISSIMNNDTERNIMAINAIEKSKKYEIDKIAKQWEEIFKNLMVDNK